VAAVVARASEAAFGRPLVTNVLRAMLVEAIVAEVLSDAWTWCSADYASWDFQSPDGVRLEVKQSAARQSWATETSLPSRCSFDIAARTGGWVGQDWVAEPGRQADIYVLAHHPVADASADHRDAYQWRFYVVPTIVLPPTKRISLTGVQALTQAVSFDQLVDRVAAVKAALPVRDLAFLG
jgi:hypothetical protein